MVSNSPTESSGSPTGGILLVEEYSSLGVAITSALRKFAPLHNVQIAHSFAEAEKIAAVMRPELFLLDLDPPPSGEIAFFHKLKAQHPEARVLVIAPGTSRDLRTERGTSGAIQFIEKPFDLAEFGAAVQALLGPWAHPHSRHVRGTLRHLHLVDLVQLKCLALGSAVVRLETDDGRSGAIYFRRGQIYHAVAGARSGVAALEEITTWPDGHLSETDLPADVPATINLSWPALLLPVVRRLAEENKEDASGEASPQPSEVAASGKKILLIDDTDMLVVFVADTLAIADQTLQIITASTGDAGIRLAAAERPDLILLDYSLSDMTGDKVCYALLENDATARIPVLMMSGHLTELARTAHDYRNVVASLPKPFVSGALINAVEIALAAGSLPKAPPAPVGPEAATIPPAPVSMAESPTTPLPDKNDEPLASPRPGAEEATNSPTGELWEKSVIAAAKTVAQTEPQSAPAAAPLTAGSRPSISLVRQMEVNVTLALDIVSIQLTPSFRMEAAALQPCNSVVLVKADKQSEFGGVPLENGFRLGPIRLFDDGAVDTIRLIPTHQTPQLPALKSSFAVRSVSPERTNTHQNLRFTAPQDKTMRVLLTMQCDLLGVELSTAFEVEAVMLKARGATVLVRNDPGSSGAPFVVEGVELGSSDELRVLFVRAIAA